MSESHVENAITARIARVAAEQERKRLERAELAAARTAGVARRHAQKLARSQPNPAHNPEDTPMPTTPFRPAVCPGCRAQRTVRRVGTTTVSRVGYDIVRCPQTGCELLWLTRHEQPHPAPTAA